MSPWDNEGSLPVNDFQLYLTIGVPTIAVLASLTVSLVQISAIRQDMAENLREIRADIRELRADMRGIRAEMLEIRNDIKIIVSKLVELDNRVTRIEDRLAH